MLTPNGQIANDGSPKYSCKHWNRETRNCMDYENRPSMCRRFPYGTPCPYIAKGCTWTDAEQATKKTLKKETTDV